MVDDRIARLEDRMGKVEQEVVATRVEVREARIDIGELVTSIQGPPRDDSIRGRLHRLEDSEATAKAAEAALTMAKTVHAQQGERTFTRREKVAGVFIAACVLLSQWLAPLIYHQPHS